MSPPNSVVPAVDRETLQQAFSLEGRVGHTATVLHDARILITGGGQLNPVGGGLDPMTITRSAEIYDVETGEFLAVLDAASMLSPMDVPRAFHTATLLADGRVLLAGGFTNSAGAFATTATWEIFDPATCSFPDGEPGSQVVTSCVFEPGANVMARARGRHAATLRGDGAVLLTGGEIVTAGMDTLYLASTELWTEVGGFAPSGAFPMSAARSCHAQALVEDGSGDVLVTGGYAESATGDLEVLSSVERFVGTSITGVMTMSTPRACHTLTSVELDGASGAILAIGGFTDTMGGVLSIPSPIIELFDSSVNQFLPMLSRQITAGGDPVGIARHTATALPDGRIVILGGMTSANVTGVVAGIISLNGAIISAELDASVMLLRPRAGHTASLLPSGQILMVGGFDSAMNTTHMAGEFYTPPVVP